MCVSCEEEQNKEHAVSIQIRGDPKSGWTENTDVWRWILDGPHVNWEEDWFQKLSVLDLETEKKNDINGKKAKLK